MKSQESFRQGRKIVHTLNAHLVFVTKYRRGVITDRVREHLQTTCTSVMRDFGGSLLACDGGDDHLHLLIAYPPQYSVASLVNSLKGVSARLLRKEGYAEVKGKLWGDHFWSPSYFVASTGGVTLETLRHYVEQQRQPAKKGGTSSPP
jgi:putative transposase